MATTNVPVSSTWSLAVAAGDDFLLSANGNVEFAITGDDATTPTLSLGHNLSTGSGVTRDMVGAGSVWARSIGVSPTTVVVTILA